MNTENDTVSDGEEGSTSGSMTASGGCLFCNGDGYYCELHEELPPPCAQAAYAAARKDGQS